MLLWQRGIPFRRPGRFSSAPISSALASGARPTTVSCRRKSRISFVGRSGSSPRLPRTAGRTAPLHGAATLPWYYQNNPYSFSFPASSSSFPVAQQNQPVFIKVFKKQAKKKEPLSGSKGKILSLYDFSLFFLMSLSDVLSEQAKTHGKYRAYHGFSCALVHSGQICRGLKRCLPRLFFMCFGFAPDPQDPRPVNFADFHGRGAAGLPAAFPQ